MIGNLMGDFVKGNNYRRYNLEIQNGIFVHRKVDSFTDGHPVFIRSTHRLGNEFRLLKGVIVDVFYDHFLAVNWEDYSEQPLHQFARTVYRELQDRYSILPARLQRMLPRMISGNWLESYGAIEGIEKALNGMSRRITRENQLAESVVVLRDFYSEFQRDFREFFPELIDYAAQVTLEFQKQN